MTDNYKACNKANRISLNFCYKLILFYFTISNDIETLFKYLNCKMQIAKGPNILNLHAYTQGEE